MSDSWGEFPIAEQLEQCRKETASITLRRLADDVAELRDDIHNDPAEIHAYDMVLELLGTRLQEVMEDGPGAQTRSSEDGGSEG